MYVYNLNLKSYLSRKNGVSEKDDSGVIISITTYPKRFKGFNVAMESLMNQSVKPDRIIVFLSQAEVEPKGIPIYLKLMKSRGVEIEFVAENYKSYKKLIYIYGNTNKNIITCDDDVIYPINFVENLVNKNINYPEDILTYRANLITFNECGEINRYKRWYSADQNDNALLMLPTGCSGILYPPNSLEEDLVKNSDLFLELSPHADDIWFKVCSLKKGTNIRLVENFSVDFPLVTGTQKTALWIENVECGNNDCCIKNVFEYFKLYEFFKSKLIEECKRGNVYE